MKNSGFTILEIAIVFIIVGLIVGGIVQGMSMIRQSEMQRLITDISDLTNATSQFVDKYGSMPGDMPNATTVWGRADGGADVTQNCANPDTDINPSDPLATCNGNGNNRIADYDLPVANRNSEAYRFWQHLSNAGLITGKYTGIGGTEFASPWKNAIPGENVMGSAISGLGFFIREKQLGQECNAGSGWTGLDTTIYKNFMHIGGITPNSYPWKKIFTPEEVNSVDLKIDDGKPGLGNIVVICPINCATSTDTETAEYANATDDKKCTMMMPFSE